MLEAIAGWPARNLLRGLATANGKGFMNNPGRFGKLILRCNMVTGQNPRVVPLWGDWTHGPQITGQPGGGGNVSGAVSFGGPLFAEMETAVHKTLSLLALTAALMGAAACNTTTEQKAAAGAVGGAVVAGPVGAVVGGAAGAVAGHAQTEANEKH